MAFKRGNKQNEKAAPEVETIGSSQVTLPVSDAAEAVREKLLTSRLLWRQQPVQAGLHCCHSRLLLDLH